MCLHGYLFQGENVQEMMVRVRKLVESLPVQSDFELYMEEEEVNLLLFCNRYTCIYMVSFFIDTCTHSLALPLVHVLYENKFTYIHTYISPLLLIVMIS